MGACRECTYVKVSKEDGLTRCYHESTTAPGHPMPSMFRWCTHFESRGEYYRLQYPALIESVEGRKAYFQLHIGNRTLNLDGYEVRDIFRKVSPIEAEAAANIREKNQ